MLINPNNIIKKSAESVMQFSDLIINTDGKQFDYDIDKIKYFNNQWLPDIRNNKERERNKDKVREKS